MEKRTRHAVLVVVIVLTLALGYVGATSLSNGNTKTVVVEAGSLEGGAMYFHCMAEESSPGVCDPENASRVLVSHRDRVTLTVRTDDGRPHSHDFRLRGAAYGSPFPWVELELKKPVETRTFTAWKTGTFPFVCELTGHAEAGMVGTLVVAG